MTKQSTEKKSDTDMWLRPHHGSSKNKNVSFYTHRHLENAFLNTRKVFYNKWIYHICTFLTFLHLHYPYLNHLTYLSFWHKSQKLNSWKFFFRKTRIPVKIWKTTCLQIDEISMRLLRLEFKGITKPSKFLFLFLFFFFFFS